MGNDTPPDWLRTEFFTDLFGGPKRIHEFVLSYHRGAKRYPDGFDPETGLFGRRAIEGEGSSKNAVKIKKVASRRAHPRHRDPDEVLRRVCRLTGSRPSDLMKSTQGRGANPARRFAIWALNRSADMTQRQIAERLAVPYNQVTRLLSRLRAAEPVEPLRSWIEEWLADE